jgi:hypothetical protein
MVTVGRVDILKKWRSGEVERWMKMKPQAAGRQPFIAAKPQALTTTKMAEMLAEPTRCMFG